MPALKKFNVTVQGKFYKVIETENTGAALSAVAADIAAGMVLDFDPAQPHNIVIQPPLPDTFAQWAAVAPQEPHRYDVWLAPDETEWIYDQPRDANGRYIADDHDTPEKESALRWVPHTEINP